MHRRAKLRQVVFGDRPSVSEVRKFCPQRLVTCPVRGCTVDSGLFMTEKNFFGNRFTRFSTVTSMPIYGLRFRALGQTNYYSGPAGLEPGEHVLIEAEQGHAPVSYTHLDVYKRQRLPSV